ncbi:MAG: flagellar basal body P-ring protein FlgI [Burkholderiales bacterium]
MSRSARFSLVAILVIALAIVYAPARGERLKDLAGVAGVRTNQLVGYGLVVGLDNTGDQTTQTPFTTQSLNSMLAQLGVTIAPGTSMQLKNVAAVMVIGQLEPFSQPGQTIDVTVSSLGNAKSLRGGTLILTPLKGADGQVYAMAQGNVAVPGAGAQSGGNATKVNQLATGRIPGGATVERAVPSALGQAAYVDLDLRQPDFLVSQRVADAINQASGMQVASALDGRVIRVAAPVEPDARVRFLAKLENLDIEAGVPAAKVVFNARTGSIVMNKAVVLDSCAVSHGNLTITITQDQQASQPAPFSYGTTAITNNTSISMKQDGNGFSMLNGGAKLPDVVRALNTLGATPQDLLAILQAIKAAGALRAELEVI